MKIAQKKTLTFIEALAIVVGMIIGSGIFLKPSAVLTSAGTPIASLLAWIAGGIITLASALSIAEIASAIPRTGGLYVYLEELYGESVGFLLGWVQTIISYPASIAAQAIAFATYANIFLPMSDWQQKLMAFSVLGFLPRIITWSIIGVNITDPFSVKFMAPIIILLSLTGISVLVLRTMLKYIDKKKES